MPEQKIIDRDTYRAIKKMSREELQAFLMRYVIIPPLGTHRSATRKTVIRIKERTNPKRGTHQSAQGTHLPLRS